MSYNVKMNQNKILTTHTGSLPRPEELIKTMWALGDGIPVDNKILEERIAEAVYLIVEKQLNAGIDIINDEKCQNQVTQLMLKIG